MYPTFLMQFQENITAESLSNYTGTETLTKTLEESDQDISNRLFSSKNIIQTENTQFSYAVGTETLTRTAEERDQDDSRLVPKAFYGTNTITNAIEESDQDRPGVHPPISFLGTTTITDSVEEGDQDKTHQNYLTFN